jgi:hypothetical protein
MSAQTLKQISTIDLPGPAGQRFDYLTMDAGRASRITWQYGSKELTRMNRIIFVKHLGQTQVLYLIPSCLNCLSSMKLESSMASECAL